METNKRLTEKDYCGYDIKGRKEMLVFRILATIFLGFSCFTALAKNVNIYVDKGKYNDTAIFVSTIYGWLWRAFVLVALWLI